MESQESSEAWSSLSMPSNVQSLEDSYRNDAPAESGDKPRKDSEDDQSSGEEEIESPLRPAEIQECPTEVAEVSHAGTAVPSESSLSPGGRGGGANMGPKRQDLQEIAMALQPGKLRMPPDPYNEPCFKPMNFAWYISLL